MTHCLLLWSKLSGGERRKANGKSLLLFVFALFSSQLIFAQGTVKGRVFSGDTALASVTVQIKGSNVATATDNSGNFSISVPANAVLVISNIGYTTQEVPVNNRLNITVRLENANRQLEEVVVVGYGTQKRKDVTGSVSSVSSEQIKNVPITTLDQALQGRSSGVQVTNNDGALAAACRSRSGVSAVLAPTTRCMW